MKNINFKSIIIGCLLMTCIFLFMGQSNKDGHFNTVYADEIILKGSDDITQIGSNGLMTNGSILIGEGTTDELFHYIELRASSIAIYDLVDDTEAHFNAWGIGFINENHEDPDAVFGKSEAGGGFIYIQDEYGKEILAKP